MPGEMNSKDSAAAESRQSSVQHEAAAQEVADTVLKLIDDFHAGAQRADTSMVTYMDRIVLVAGGTLTLIFTVSGGISTHLYETRQQAKDIPFVSASCWLLVATIFSAMLCSRFFIVLAMLRGQQTTIVRTSTELRHTLLKFLPRTQEVTAAVATMSPIGKNLKLSKKVRSNERAANLFGTIAQISLAMAFFFLVLFVQANISILLAPRISQPAGAAAGPVAPHSAK